MENVTLGQILALIVFVVALIEGIGKLINPTKKMLTKALADEFEPIKKQLAEIKSEVDDNSLEQCKNFLTKCFDDLDRGVQLSDTTIERIYECFSKYEKLGGNGFIHKRFDDLKKQNKL